jgi:hypothetical protein
MEDAPLLFTRPGSPQGVCRRKQPATILSVALSPMIAFALISCMFESAGPYEFECEPECSLAGPPGGWPDGPPGNGCGNKRDQEHCAPSDPDDPTDPDDPVDPVAPGDPNDPGDPDDPGDPGDPGARDLSLRGDPSFDPAKLSDEARLWYRRYWAAIEHSNPRYDAEELAKSDDISTYGRALHREMTSRLTAFRATGDLRILDEIDRIAQHMRARLADGWCDGLGGKDGYLNWRYRRKSDHKHWCKDTYVMEEMLTHANVAHFAYAFHANRDLPSPGGVDYAERADFWRDYLENHFEAKWRDRNRRSWPRMDFLTRALFHPHINFLRYYVYMHKLTGKDEYRQFAEQNIDALLDSKRIMGEHSGGFLEVDTPLGTGIVWAHRHADWERLAQMSTYVRYTTNAVYDLALEGAHRIDAEVVHKIGVSIAHFIMITEPPLASTSEPFGPSIVGSRRVHGDGWSMEPSGSSFSISRFMLSQYHVPLIFMHPGEAYEKMMRVTLDAYATGERDHENPRNLHVPAVLLAEAVRRAGE